MALLGTLQVRMGLDTASFGTKFNSFAKDMEKRSKGFAKGLSGLTNFGSLIGGAGIGAALTQGINVAGDFESSINQVAAAADLGRDSIAGLSQLALDLSKGTVFSANQTAEAMLALAKAGIMPAEQSAGTLAATMQLAATEGMDLARASEVLAEQMGAFKLVAADGASIADALAGASIASTALVEGLSLGLSAVGKVAKDHGLTLQETAATLSLFAQNGIKGSDAGTSFKTMLTNLIPKSDDAAAAMKEFNLSFTAADGKFKDITDIAEILHTRLGGLAEAQRAATLQTIFGTDAIRAASILTAEGASGLQKYIEATQDKNAAEKLSEARTQGLNGALARFRNTLSGLAIELSKGGFLEALTSIATKGAEFVVKLAALPQWAKTLGVSFAVAAAALPPLALAISSIVTAGPAILTALGAVTAFLTGPWGIAIGAAVGVAILFKDQLISAWNGIKAWFAGWVENNQGALQNLKAAWDGLLAALVPLWEAIKSGFKLFGDAILSAFGTDSSQLVTDFKEGLSVDLTNAVFIVTDFLEALTQIVTWFTTNVPILAEKGYAIYTGIADWLGQTKDMWVEIWNGLIQDIENAWIEIKSTIRNAADAIITWWRELDWRELDWGELGRAVVEGIVNGIKSRATAAADAARTLGSTIITAAKVVLDSHSPSRVFHGIGQDVGDGFVNGIASKFGDAKLAVGKLVGAGTDSGFTNSFLSGFTRNLTGDAGKKRFEDFTKSIKDGALQAQSAWTSSMNHIGSAIDEFVKTGKLNFSDLVRSMIADLASSALKNAFNGLLQGIMGITGGGSIVGTGSLASGGGGWLSGLGSIFGGLFGGMASFEGGGYTGDGSRSGGLDGRGGRLAMIHPRETVIDHAAVKRVADRGRSRGDIHISTPITLMPGVSKEELGQILPMLKRDIIETIPALIARGGNYAAAYGR